jgi:short-subunit dehydrogenase
MPAARPLALITGASAGLGASFARQLASEGYDLILVARRTEELNQVAAEIRSQHGAAVETITADLTRDEGIAAVGGKLASTDRVHLLVNNAGFGTRGFFFESDPRQEDNMYRLHVIATGRLTRAALPGMVARRAGGIINVASVAAFVPGPGNVSYCATKAWMVNFTEGIWLELKSIGSPVTIQALCPGYTYTELHDVMGVDRAGIMNPNWWMSADFVAGESIRGLKEGKPLVIPGWRYRLVVAFAKFMPRSLVLKAAMRQASRIGKLRKPAGGPY